MKRRIIEMDQDKCNGCGACAAACHEGAIAMVDGLAGGRITKSSEKGVLRGGVSF